MVARQNISFFSQFSPSRLIIPLEHKGLPGMKKNEKTCEEIGISQKKKTGFSKREDDD